jgi:hypothetical protein
MTMEWCLSCHRAPEQHLRPPAEVFNMDWPAPKDQVSLSPELIKDPRLEEMRRMAVKDQVSLGRELIKEHRIPVKQLTDCYTCHR